MVLSYSEVIDLAIAVAALPAVFLMSRRLPRMAGRVWLVAAYVSVVASGVFTIAEGVGGFAGEWLNLAEHVSLLGAGSALCVMAIRMRGALSLRGGTSR